MTSLNASDKSFYYEICTCIFNIVIWCTNTHKCDTGSQMGYDYYDMCTVSRKIYMNSTLRITQFYANIVYGCECYSGAHYSHIHNISPIV